MDSRDSESPGGADFTAAIPLEITEETAARADDLLREFAEDAGLETALVVDRSGALVAGISAEAEVTIEVISALVAGASGAMRALVAQLGETGVMESLHLGGNRLIYLKETVHRFILVGVAESSRPAGLVRQKALAIDGRLAEILREIRPAEPPVAPPPPPVKSLREVARERARQRIVSPPSIPIPEETESEDEGGPLPEVASEVEEPVVLPCGEEPRYDETFETLELQPELEPADEPLPESRAAVDESAAVAVPEAMDETGMETATAEPPAPPAEPKEILEPIDFGEPEIVIEGSTSFGGSKPSVSRLPVDSPFEADDWGEENAPPELEIENLVGPNDFVFEMEEEGELPILTSPGSVFEIEDDEEIGEDGQKEDAELEAPPLSAFTSPPPVSLFEEDDGTEDDAEEEDASGWSVPEAGEIIFEVDEDDDEWGDENLEGDPVEGDPVEGDPFSSKAKSGEEACEIEQMIEEEEEESEIRSSGPFYF